MLGIEYGCCVDAVLLREERQGKRGRLSERELERGERGKDNHGVWGPSLWRGADGSGPTHGRGGRP